jgi:calcineurin-like phosphoesterase family protein
MTTWITSDLHFSHKGVVKFTNNDGSKMRPWDTIEEMDEELIRRFNEKVSVDDECFILGDVTLNRSGLPLLDRLNCKNLILIKGNHDYFRLDEYTPYFKDIRSYHVVENVLFSHIPVHPSQLEYRFKMNVHGHMHGEILDDVRYLNVSVEQTDYYPILLEDILTFSRTFFS